jgi:hypothetical protein
MTIDGVDVSGYTSSQISQLLSGKNVIKMQLLPSPSPLFSGTHAAAAAITSSASSLVFQAGASLSSQTNHSVATLGILLLFNFAMFLMLHSRHHNVLNASLTPSQKRAKKRLRSAPHSVWEVLP